VSALERVLIAVFLVNEVVGFDSASQRVPAAMRTLVGKLSKSG
jgi:hypothetical protein